MIVVAWVALGCVLGIGLTLLLAVCAVGDVER